MKNLSILFVSASILMLLTQCSNPSVDKLCSSAETRGKIISELINNHDYMNQVMDSMMHNSHGMKMIAGSHDMMRTMMSGRGMTNMMMSDTSTKNMLMNDMMKMCSSDTSMCKMIMGKTMEMCDMDKSKCKMMMGSMQDHPKGMESMKDMGMCNMKGMNMNQKKGDHSKHH